MLIPRFSIRWLLGLTTFSALVSLVLAYAVRGNPWAIGIVAGLWAVVIIAVFYATAFLCAWLMNQFLTVTFAKRAGGGDSPFAVHLPEPSSCGITSQTTANSPPPMTG